MRNFLIILFVAVCSYSFTDVTKPYTFVPRDTIKSSKINANYDSAYSRINDLYDSLEIKFLRFNDFKDSTIDSIKVNKITSNPSIDSIQGLNVLRGNPDIDSIGGTTKFTGVKTFIDAAIFSNTVSVDSLFSTKGIKATTFTGNVTGNLTGNILGGQGTNHFDTLGTGVLNNTITVTGFAVLVHPQAGATRDTLRYISGGGDFLTVINSTSGDTIFITAHDSVEDTLFKSGDNITMVQNNGIWFKISKFIKP